jgi:hypothetical protein
MMEIRIVYTDESIVTRPVGEVNQFVQTGVLWIGLFAPSTQEPSGRLLLQEKSGFDFYAVLLDNRPGPHWGLMGWDVDDVVMNREVSPLATTARQPETPPIQYIHRVFTGEFDADFAGIMSRTRSRNR